MRFLLLLALLPVGCVRPPLPTVAHVTLEQPVYTYWYSAAQRLTLNNLRNINSAIASHYWVTVNGKQIEYTDCELGDGLPQGRFNDYVKVAQTAGSCDALVKPIAR